MGYGVMPYRVDTNAVSGLYGSKKKDLAEKLQPRITSLDESFEPEYGWKTTEGLLETFLQGDNAFFEYEYNNAKHWYVIEMLIRECGEILSNGEWYPGGNIDPFYKLDEFKMYSFDKESRLDLASPDDFPVVFTVYRDSLDEAASHANTIEDQDQKEQFLKWIETAREHNEDLVLFYYWVIIVLSHGIHFTAPSGDLLSPI